MSSISQVRHVSVEELRVDDEFVSGRQYPRKLYALVLSYCSLSRPSQIDFANLLVTDLTSSFDTFRDISTENRFCISATDDALDATSILKIDLRKRDLQPFLTQASAVVNKQFPPPSIDSFDKILEDKFLVEANGVVDRFRDKIYFKRAKIRLLDASFIKSHIQEGDKYLTKFIKRLQQHTRDDKAVNALLNSRYHFQEVFDSSNQYTQKSKRKKAQGLPRTTSGNVRMSFGIKPDNSGGKPEYNDSTKQVLALLNSGKGLAGGKRTLSQAVRTDLDGYECANGLSEEDELTELATKRMREQKYRTNDTMFKEEDISELDAFSQTHLHHPTPLITSSEDYKEVAFNMEDATSTVRETTLERLIADKKLFGTFLLRGVRVLGYLPAEGNALLVENSTSQSRTLTSQFQIVVCPNKMSSVYSPLGASGDCIAKTFLRVSFKTPLAAFGLLEITDPNNLNESTVKLKADRLVGKVIDVHVTRVAGSKKWYFAISNA